jgi:hypothetical protein
MESAHRSTAMLALLHLLFVLAFGRFKSRRGLEIENLYLRHQLNIAMRKAPDAFPPARI